MAEITQLDLPGSPKEGAPKEQPTLDLPKHGDWRGGYPKPSRHELIEALEVVLRALKNGWR